MRVAGTDRGGDNAMKLISCYIDNFGGLQDFSLEFNSGITVINEPNGFGKTTLATFIRTMLYGFPRNSKIMGKNDRKKFVPWQSGTFGGNIVFEHDGERYRVERTFGATPKSDTFTLYKLDPLRKCENFSDQLGQEIFGLDADSFERSTYMPQMREDNSFATANIQAKLGNLVEDTNDINNFDGAVDRLKKVRAKMISYRGVAGTVADAQRKIAEIELEIRDLKEKKNRLLGCTDDAKQLEKEIEEKNLRVEKLREELSSAYSSAVRAELEKQHIKLLQEQKEIESQLGAYQNKTVPSEEDFKTYREKIEKLTADKALLNNIREQLQDESSEKRLPDEEEIQNNREKLSKIDALRRENSRSIVDANPQKKKKIALPLAIAGMVFAVFAVVLFVLAKYAFGAAVIAIGAVLLIGAVYFGIKEMVSSQIATADKAALQEAEKKIQNLEDEVREFALNYGAEQENLFDAVNGLSIMLEKSRTFEKSLESAKKIEQEISEIEGETLNFLSQYVGISDTQNLAEIFNKLHLEANKQTAMYSALLQRKQNNAVELEAFLKHNEETLKLPLGEKTADTEQLKAQETQLVSLLNEKNRALSELKSTIRTLQSETDAIPELEDEILRLQQLKADDTYKSGVIDKTIDFLTNARDSLSMSYLGTVKKHFIDYMKQLSEETGDTVFVDKDLEVTLERRGVARELGFFSAGYSDIVMLCMRFALVDALFPDTKPFIILDDPFINLDDSNTKKAIELLKRLGEGRQIIYLVCNSSRALEQ